MKALRASRTLAGLLGAALLMASPGAFAADWGIGARAGTLGLGVDISRSFTPFFNARVGVNGYDYGFDFETNDFDYDGDLELESYHALVDFHPFTGGFRLTGGLVRNNNQIVATGTHKSTGASADVTVDFDDNAPYAGIGWGNHTSGFIPLSFSIDIGVLGQGEPQVDCPTCPADEEQDIEDELSDYDVYPVVSAGLIFRF